MAEEPAFVVLGDLSGPKAAAFASAFEAMISGFKYISEVEGGIDGAKTGMRWVDTQIGNQPCWLDQHFLTCSQSFDHRGP
jgi:hypothetical protein